MEYFAYILLSIVAVIWIIAMVVGFVVAFPSGLIGLVVLFAVGLLFIKVLKERLNSKEDDHYIKNVKQ